MSQRQRAKKRGREQPVNRTSLSQADAILHAAKTTQLRRKVTWVKGPTTEPRTRDLRSIEEC